MLIWPVHLNARASKSRIIARNWPAADDEHCVRLAYVSERRRLIKGAELARGTIERQSAAAEKGLRWSRRTGSDAANRKLSGAAFD